MPPSDDSSTTRPATTADGEDPALTAALADLRTGNNTEAAFRVVFDRFYRPVNSYFARRVAAAEDRLDLTQETFLRIYRGIGGFRGDSKLGTWVFRVARNTHLKWIERRRRSGVTDLDPPAAGDPGVDDEVPPGAVEYPQDPHRDLLRRERRDRLREAILELPDQMRRCMILRVYQGMSYQEVAETMRLSIDTVKAHLFQGRKRLKARCAEDRRTGQESRGG